MFIERSVKREAAPFEEAEWCWSGKSLLDFRFFERSRRGSCVSIYKHLTPRGVKPVNCFKTNDVPCYTRGTVSF